MLLGKESDIKEGRKFNLTDEIKEFLPSNIKNQFSLVDEIFEINKETLLSVFTKIQKCGELIPFIFSIIEHGIAIRPHKSATLLSLLCLLAGNYGYKNHVSTNFRVDSMLVQQGIICRDRKILKPKKVLIQEDEIFNIFMKDDLETFMKKSSQAGFDPKLSFKISKSSAIWFVNESSETVSYLQIMAFYGAVKCINHALSNKAFELDNVAQYAVAGGSMKTVQILLSKDISFKNCLEVAVKYHRNEIGFLIMDKYKYDTNSLVNSCKYFNYEYLIFGLMNGIDASDALLQAIKQCNIEVAKYLIKDCNANVETKDSNGRTPIYFASQAGFLEIIKYLVEQHHVDTNIKDKYGNTPLNVASYKGHLDVVKYLVENCHANVEISDSNGWTPLNYASYNGNIEVISYLYEHYHANIETKDKVNENTPLHNASYWGYLNVVKYLVEKCNANVELKNKHGYTPLNIASQNNHISIVKYLVEHCHVNVESKDNDGRTPISLAAWNDNIDIVKYLYEKRKVSVEAKNKAGITPIFYALSKGHLEVVEYLAEQCSANIEVKDNRGNTPLNWASASGHLEIVKYLVEKRNAKITEQTIFNAKTDDIKRYLHSKQ